MPIPMMKQISINEWAEAFCSAPENQRKAVLDRILTQDMFGQIRVMISTSQRLTVRVSEEAALCAALNELDRRWRLFAEKVNRKFKLQLIKPDGFVDLLKETFMDPDIYFWWMEIRERIKMPRLGSHITPAANT